jgi:hypothetical protein
MFSSSISGLELNTTYYVRAYATNGAGTAYGDEVSFSYGLPTVETASITAITGTKCTGGGDVTFDGNVSITARGVCWNTVGTPTINNSKTADGTGTGAFASYISGLALNTTYYARAYATNGAGTVYGDEISFTTDNDYHLRDTGPAGGWVFYDKGFYSDGWRFMEAAPVDQSTGVQWYNGSSTSTGAIETAIGTGSANTAQIISDQGEGTYAATVCTAYEGGGYIDWFLPSKDELNQMYVNLKVYGVGGLTDANYYWSSSESSDLAACIQYLFNGNQGQNTKDGLLYVRAVRVF